MMVPYGAAMPLRGGQTVDERGDLLRCESFWDVHGKDEVISVQPHLRLVLLDVFMTPDPKLICKQRRVDPLRLLA